MTYIDFFLRTVQYYNIPLPFCHWEFFKDFSFWTSEFTVISMMLVLLYMSPPFILRSMSQSSQSSLGDLLNRPSHLLLFGYLPKNIPSLSSEFHFCKISFFLGVISFPLLYRRKKKNTQYSFWNMVGIK